MCLGDSVTAGYTDNPSWTVEFDFGFRSGLYTRLTNAGYSIQFVGESPEPWNGTYGMPKAIGSPDLRNVDQDHHRGYAWMTADNAATQIANWMEKDKADIILVMLGSIDFPNGVARNIDIPKKHLSDFVELVVTTWPRLRLVIAQTSPFALFEPGLIEYNDWVKNVLVPDYASRGKRVTVADLYSPLLSSPADLTSIDTGLLSGWQHPNPAGYERLAQAYFEAFQAVYPREPAAIISPPQIQANGHFHIGFSGVANAIYRVDRAAAPTGPWDIGIANLIADLHGLFELDDANPGPERSRFYRIALE